MSENGPAGGNGPSGRPERYDAMIAYAATRGWTDEARTQVRAHVEPAPHGWLDSLRPGA